MRITGVTTATAQIPVDPPVRTAIHDISTVDAVVINVSTTEATLAGQSYVFAFGARRAVAIRELVEDLAGVLHGQDPRCVRHLWQRMWASLNFLGRKGAQVMALSGLDIALWDLLGKYHDAPVHRLLGGSDEPIPVYASGGFYVNHSREKMQDDAEFFITEGFDAVKMRVGSTDVGRDLERVAFVRDRIGPRRALMVDANQGWDRRQAKAFCDGAEASDLYWIEDPFDFDDRDSHRWLAERTSIPIATGETEFTRFGARDWVDIGIRYFLPDVSRMGGVTEWMRAADLLSTYGIDVASHLYFEYSVALLACCPNAVFAEQMRNPLSDRTDALFANPLRASGGTVTPRDAPGFGMQFADHIVERLAAQP